MAWNNRLEKNKFDKRQARLAAKYRAAGMTEEQIEKMHQFDLEEYNNTRRYFEHNIQMPENFFGTDDEGLCPLNDTLLDAISVTNEQSDAKSRYWWIDEIENPRLAKAVRRLSAKDLELITLYAFEKYTVQELTVKLGIPQSTVYQRLGSIEKKLKKLSGNYGKNGCFVG